MTVPRKNVGKDPSFQFYWKDWLADSKLMVAPSSLKGTWVDLMCISMDMPVKGVFHDGQRPLTDAEVAEIVPGDKKVASSNLQALIARNICKRIEDGPFAGSLYVKRLYLDMRLREVRHNAGKMGGNPVLLKVPGNKCAPSSDSASIASPLEAPQGACAGDALFDRFWSVYPKKVAKDAARRAFAKRKPSEALLAKMLAAIEAQKRTDSWTQEHGRYIPHPATWLNQGRWEDAVGPVNLAPKASREVVHKCYDCGKNRAESKMMPNPRLPGSWVCRGGCNHAV